MNNLFIGKDKKTDEDAFIDASKSRAILICGKRGSGKSYTLGNLAEELQSNCNDALCLIIDPMGIYWTMCNPNFDQEKILWEWGLSPRGLNVKILVPGDSKIRYGEDVVDVMEEHGVQFQSISLNPSDISPDGWCDLFNLSINDAMGIVLYRAVQGLKKQYKNDFYIKDIITSIEYDPKANDKSREALLNRLEMADAWGLFGETYTNTWDSFDTNSVNIVDLSVLDPGRYGTRNLVVSMFCRDLFTKRTEARRREELGLSTSTPKVWLMIDEAHQFAPSGKSTLSKELLVRWVKEGRQPGLSLVVATQQPSAIDHEVLSQCDIVISHKITTKEDVDALNKLSQDYMGSELKTYIRNIKGNGEAVMVDDENEKVSMIQIRPRKCKHGGGEHNEKKKY